MNSLSVIWWYTLDIVCSEQPQDQCHNGMHQSNSTGAEYVTCKLKLNEEKSKHVGLAQQNDFGPAFLYGFLTLIKGQAKPNTCS